MTPQPNRREFIATAALGAVSILSGLHAAGESAGLHLTLGEYEGKVGVGLQSLASGRVIILQSAVEGYAPVGKPRLRAQAGGRWETSRRWNAVLGGGHCEVVEQFELSAAGEVAWKFSLEGSGAATSAPIHLIARYPATADTRFWTAWSDASQPAGALPREPMKVWADPLRAMPLRSRHFFYGAPPYTHADPVLSFTPSTRDLIALPLASFLEPASDTGTSMVIAPGGGSGLLDLTLTTDEKGTADFAFTNHRFQPGRPVELTATIVCHEADWRGGLRWMTERYPRFFTPHLPLADDLDGTAAYSSDVKLEVDAEKLKRMAFRVNWKASFDFPYMGMFLPPVGDAAWGRYITDDTGLRKPGTQLTSIRQMAQYSEEMRQRGFYVLNYFNVTEFGSDIVYPPPPRKEPQDKQLWRNANDFLYTKLPGAILHVPVGMAPQFLAPKTKLRVGGPFYTWGNGIAMDCGDPAYERFLLDQAQAHVKKLPASSGVCIDRMDWLRFYNEDRDDGLTWFSGKPVRALSHSWRSFMAKLLPVFHDAGKVVFVNNHTKRVDLLEDIDGIYDEFAVNPGSLNLTGLLCVSRPGLGWTNDESALRPDPDGFFQRFLYLGVFPTAPFPGNDHALSPSPWVDQQYLDYGPLMNALHGRKWVLKAHAVAVEGGEANANLFAVGAGYAIPVTQGGAHTLARVSVADLGLAAVTADALLPGAPEPVPVVAKKEAGRWVFDVPLGRGCAMLRLR